MRDALHNFAQEAVGKPYGVLSLFNFLPAKRKGRAAGSSRRPPAPATIFQRLLRKPTETGVDQQQPQQQPQQMQNRGMEEEEFFCSKLVAAGLKAMGVISPDVNSSRFWPGSFAQGGDIDKDGAMLPGWRFGEVIVVDTKTLELESAVLTSV